MAFDHAGFFAIVGKYVKAINLWDGYIAAITSSKAEIRDVYEAEDLHDLYGTLPALLAQYQASITQAIFGSVSHLNGLLLDRDYTVEQLGLFDLSVSGVLDAIHKYMVDNSLTLETSVVSLGGSDTDNQIAVGSVYGPYLFAHRKLDGVNSPGNGVAPNGRYLGLESQLARTTTVYAEIVSNSIPGAEIVQLYSLADNTGGYQVQDEEPGNGPQLVNVESGNLVGNNWDFSQWTGDAPANWSVSGTPTTDYIDASGSGAGPFRAITNTDVTLRRQITGLEKNRMYFFAVHWAVMPNDSTSTPEVKITLETLAGTTLVTARTQTVTVLIADILHYQITYSFFTLGDNVDLTDVYLEVEVETLPTEADYINIYKAVVVPATYYNGLAWAWWAPIRNLASTAYTALKTRQSMTVSNNNNGVFQTFFRKAYGVQLPTADSPAIDDALAS